MVRRVALLAVALVLAGCGTVPPLTDRVTLSVRSYDPTSGAYELVLDNQSRHPIVYLSSYFTFNTIRRPDAAPYPDSPNGDVLMASRRQLNPGTATIFSGICTSAALCSQPRTYVAVRACWFTETWSCEQYWPIWSQTPVNGT